MGNPSRGRQRFRTYVEQEWPPNHQMEARTRETYGYYLGRHILPWFGAMRMVEIMPADVREWITHLQNENVSAHVIRYCKTILSARPNCFFHVLCMSSTGFTESRIRNC
jgi:Phage integrase, N-terminal SAM-like domain